MTFITLGEAKETETCDISCGTSIRTNDSNRKSNPKLLSDHIIEMINSDAKMLAVWDEWQEWQPCTRTCGTGTRIRLTKL